MREIKFRGQKWDKTFIYGSVAYSDNIEPAIYFEVGEGTVKEFDWACVSRESIGQYTGLKDSKNQYIYEGDIVSFPAKLNDFYSIMRQDYNEPIQDTVITEIRFDNGGFTFDYQFGYEGREVSWNDIEIIGNIHQDSHLLVDNT